MYYKSKKITLLILGITALICSRVMFMFFDDPEGPNLLVVTVMAAFIFSISSVTYLLKPATANEVSFLSFAGLNRLIMAVIVQLITVVNLYFCLR